MSNPNDLVIIRRADVEAFKQEAIFGVFRRDAVEWDKLNALLANAPVVPSADDVRDAERYRWLVADHDNKDTRQKCRDLLSRLGVMSYSAVSSEIDQAIAQEVK